MAICVVRSPAQVGNTNVVSVESLEKETRHIIQPVQCYPLELFLRGNTLLCRKEVQGNFILTPELCICLVDINQIP